MYQVEQEEPRHFIQCKCGHEEEYDYAEFIAPWGCPECGRSNCVNIVKDEND